MKIYRKDREKRGMAVALAALFAFSFILSLKQGSFIGTPTFGLFAILLFKFETLANREHAAEQAKEAYWSWYQSYYQQQQLLQPQQPQQLEPVAQ